KRGLKLASNQFEFSLLRTAPLDNGLFATCAELGVIVLAYSPIGQGRLTGKYSAENPPPGKRSFSAHPMTMVEEVVAVLRRIGAAHDRTPAEVALQWLIAKGAVPIPGAKNRKQAEDNAGGMGWSMSPDEIAALDAAGLSGVRTLQSYQSFTLAFQDTTGGLISFADARAKGESTQTQAKALSAVTGWNEAQVLSLLDALAKEVLEAPAVILMLDNCFELAAKLGADTTYTGTLAGLAVLDESQWSSYEAFASSVRHQISSLYDTETWEVNAARLQGEIEAQRRDALLGLVQWNLGKTYSDITSPDGVYEFMLIEVQTGAAVEISYIVEATNAAQLYLQRCRLLLERGIENLDIPEPWWEWIMNYRTWQANREVFLYPENYMVPSVRRNRTNLFKELENELQQSQITEDYVAEAYEGYFAGFNELAKLKPVNSYHCKVNGPDGEVDTLFLFARTETSPPTFYYCSRPEGGSWTEWVDIDVSINSDFITPVYAFNRLFIFWAELKQSTESTVSTTGETTQTSNSTTWKQSIYYSFLNHGGKWVTPQILVEERVVNYEPPNGKTVPGTDPFAPLLDMSEPSWQRVYVMKIGKGNLVYGENTPADYEKISVFCGPFMQEYASEPYTLTPNAQGENPDETAFIETMYERTVDLNSLILAKLKSQLSVTVPVNIDVNLQSNYVLTRDEFLIVSLEGNASTNPPVRGAVDSVENLLEIVPSTNVVYDNYFGDVGEGYERPAPVEPVTARGLEEAGIEKSLAEQIPPLLQSGGLLDRYYRVIQPFNSTTDIATPLESLHLTEQQLHEVREVMLESLGTMIPLRNISPVNGRLITVKNQPGWLQFDNGDESFLLTLPPIGGTGGDRTPVFRSFEEGRAVRRPTLTAKSFEVAGVEAQSAGQTYAAMREYGLIDENGNAVYQEAEQVVYKDVLPVMLAAVQPKLTEAQITAVGNVLLNTPFASADTFVSSSIDDKTAGMIVQQFRAYEIIDVTGRVSQQYVTGALVEEVLANMVMHKELTSEQVPVVYQDLVELTAPVEYAYDNPGPAQLSTLWDYVFEVTRTSTGAADRLSRALFAQGVPGLLALSSQQAPVVSILPFERFSPSQYNLTWPKLLDGAQVDFEGVYGVYYWEVFYFIPMLVANSLTVNQQFEAAETWFRYILNPTAPEEFIAPTTFHQLSEGTVSTPESEQIFEELKKHDIGTPPAPILGTPSDGNQQQGVVNPQFTPETDLSFLLEGKVKASTESVVRNVLLNYEVATPADHYWQFQPFRNATLETLKETLSDENPAIYVYENDPYDPYAIGSMRIGSFEKSTLMQYVENLISWGDSLFMQESFETTTAATMLYVYALDLLGERPVDLGPGPAREAMDFAEIQEKYPDGIPTFLIEVENTLPPPSAYAPAVEEGGTPYNDLNTYFCVPDNEKLLHYWDTIEDRLYKIRHSMNIEGEIRQLPLFAPPINPLELVKAGATGNGYLPATKGSAATIPAYRFEAMLSRARSVSAQVIEFGGKLLAALERQDGESLELLRSTQERSVLEMMTSVKEDAIGEAEGTLASLRESLAGAKNRVSTYQALISEGLDESETTNLEAMAAGLAFSILASGFRAAAAIAYTIPQIGSPFAITYGGVQVGSSMTAASAGAEIGADISNFVAQRSLTMAGYQRREQDWKLSLQSSQYEVGSLEKQIESAEEHLAGARQELAINKTEIEQNKQVYEYLKNKFTNVDLYQWMVGRISAVYFQAYKLALELALATQECYRFELGTEESFLSFNYWDNLHKGLMAGENLSFSLSQMESAYVAKNTRRLEIERTVSLALWDPNALWELRDTGKCTFELSEQLFDYDYPSQYNRQIKNIAISIPAVIGPYENFKATLKQTYSAVATSAEEASAKYMLEKTGQPPSGVRENWAPRQQIAISRGVEDSGVFQLDFRDERYLPFEGTGAVSKWELQLPQSTNRFDLNAISDVVITLRYTAQEGGETYAGTVEKLLHSYPLPGAVYLSLAQAYSAQWNAFMAEHPSEETQTLQFEVKEGSLAYLKSATLTDVFVRLETDDVAIPSKVEFLSASIDGAPKEEFQFAEEIGAIGGLTLPESKFVGAWALVFDLKQMRENPKLKQLLDAEQKYIDPTKLLNAELILSYEGSVF
ncbi:MAG: aldo/keto reductase, partial [Solirubrobacteraceae bacterium]